MPVGSGSQGVYFDLGEVRRVSRALMDAFADAGSAARLYVGQSANSKDALVLYATDGKTHALWCEDEKVFDGTTPLKVHLVTPGLFWSGVLGNDAFYKAEKSALQVSVDSTIVSKVQHRVAVISSLSASKSKEIKIPRGTSPGYTYYGKDYTVKGDVLSLITGFGMLYGFGDAPGLVCYKDRLEGITTGEKPGRFEIPGATDCEVPAPMHFTLTRPFCFVALNMMLASGIMDSPRGAYLGVFDEAATGGGNSVFLHSGKCAVYCETEEAEQPNWGECMPVAYIDQAAIDQPSALLMFSALASLVCTENTKIAGLGYSPGVGLEGRITVSSQSPGGRKDIEVLCEAELGTFPKFDLSLTKNQVIALSNTIGAAGEDAAVEFILGDDDEIVVSIGSDEHWIIRLR